MAPSNSSGRTVVAFQTKPSLRATIQGQQERMSHVYGTHLTHLLPMTSPKFQVRHSSDSTFRFTGFVPCTTACELQLCFGHPSANGPQLGTGPEDREISTLGNGISQPASDVPGILLGILQGYERTNASVREVSPTHLRLIATSRCTPRRFLYRQRPHFPKGYVAGAQRQMQGLSRQNASRTNDQQSANQTACTSQRARSLSRSSHWLFALFPPQASSLVRASAVGHRLRVDGCPHAGSACETNCPPDPQRY
jgi:hypothetical protein